MLSKFDSVDSIVDYLRSPTLSSSIVNSTTKMSQPFNEISVLLQEQENTKRPTKTMNTNPSASTYSEAQVKADIKILPEGRVR